MFPVKIKKGGKLVSTRKNTEIDLTDKLLLHLHDACEFENDLTLKDIFLLVQKLTPMLAPLLTGSSSWLDEIIDEGLKDITTTENVGLDYLELSWIASVVSYSKKDVPYLQINTNFVGFGPVPNDRLHENWPSDKINYAIDMTPTHQLVNLPIKINEYFDILDEKEGFTPHTIIEKVRKEFTLFDVLFGIFWELSFFGSPINRDKQKAELDRRIESIDKGEAELIPWEDVKKRLESKIKNEI